MRLAACKEEIQVYLFHGFHVDVFGLCGQNCKLLFVFCDGPGQEIVGTFNVCDAKESQRPFALGVSAKIWPMPSSFTPCPKLLKGRCFPSSFFPFL